MALHRAMLAGPPGAPGSLVVLDGAEAHHAVRVKRVSIGDQVELLNGKGLRAIARVESTSKSGGGGWTVELRMGESTQESEPEPALHVFTPAPKGPRYEEMLDQLSQVGATSWQPLAAERTVITPRAGKLLKAERIASEAAKQSGRAWIMSIGAGARLADALHRPGARTVLADASGRPFEHDGAQAISLMIGPEGGFTDQELRAAQEAGASICRFGRHVMRVETAAVVAAGVILDAAERYR